MPRARAHNEGNVAKSEYTEHNDLYPDAPIPPESTKYAREINIIIIEPSD